MCPGLLFWSVPDPDFCSVHSNWSRSAVHCQPLLSGSDSGARVFCFAQMRVCLLLFISCQHGGCLKTLQRRKCSLTRGHLPGERGWGGVGGAIPNILLKKRLFFLQPEDFCLHLQTLSINVVFVNNFPWHSLLSQGPL